MITVTSYEELREQRKQNPAEVIALDDGHFLRIVMPGEDEPSLSRPKEWKPPRYREEQQ